MSQILYTVLSSHVMLHLSPSTLPEVLKSFEHFHHSCHKLNSADELKRCNNFKEICNANVFRIIEIEKKRVRHFLKYDRFHGFFQVLHQS